MASQNELYFLDNSFVNAVNGLKVNYSDISKMYIKDNILVLIKNDGKQNNYFSIAYGESLSNIKLFENETIEEIKRKAPQVLTELNPENMEIIEKR